MEVSRGGGGRAVAGKGTPGEEGEGEDEAEAKQGEICQYDEKGLGIVSR